MSMAGWFLVFVVVWWLPPMLVVAEDQQGEDCSSMKCGNVTISDPFWLTDKDTRRSCGSPAYLQDFDVACRNHSSPTLRSSIPFNNGFKILNISYEERSFYAIDVGKLDVLNATDKCRAVFYNTSVKLTPPFKIAPVNLNLILYNCTEEQGAAAAARRHTELAQTSVRCGNKWEVLARAGVPHDVTGNYSGYALDGCGAVVMPVPGSSAGASVSNYEQLMRDGFLLTWDRPPGGRYNEMRGYDNYEGCDPVVMPVLASSRDANASDYEQLINNGFLLTWERPLPAPAHKFTRQIIF